MGDITPNPEEFVQKLLQKNPDQMNMGAILIIVSQSATSISGACLSAIYDACVKGGLVYEFGQVYLTTQRAPSFSQFKSIIELLVSEQKKGARRPRAEAIEVAFCLYAIACALGVQEFIGVIYTATGEPFAASAVEKVNGYKFDNSHIIPRLVNALHEHSEEVTSAVQALLDEGISPVDVSMLYYTAPDNCPFVVKTVTAKSIEIRDRRTTAFTVLQRRT